MSQSHFKTPSLRGLSVAVLASTALSCGAPEAGEPSAPIGSVRQAENTTFYELGFEAQPAYIPEKTVVLTFDDGPDYQQTAMILDILKTEKVPGAFFINRSNWSDLSEATPQALVKRMVDEGHELANHTWHHWSIGDQKNHKDLANAPQTDLTAEQIDSEITGVQEAVDTIFGAGKHPLTLFRAPFGEPFQNGPSADNYDLAAGEVKKYAVHIGWNIDSKDYEAGTAECMGAMCSFNNVKTALEGGARGVILMHSVQAQEVMDLPTTIKYLKDNGYTFWTVEQAVCAKYKSDSAHLMAGTTGGCGDVAGDGDKGGDGDVTGDGDKGGDGDVTGDGDKGGDGDVTGDGDKGDGDSGDGDSSGDGDKGGDGDTGSTGGKKDSGCSVSATPSSSNFALLAGLGLGLAFVTRRRRKS